MYSLLEVNRTMYSLLEVNRTMYSLFVLKCVECPLICVLFSNSMEFFCCMEGI